MSNKSRLQTNNTNLQALINKANALPDANGSGGGGIETVVGSVKAYGPIGIPEGVVYYVDGNGVSQQATSVGEISVMKNSFIYVKNGGGGYSTGGGATSVVLFTGLGTIYQVTEDFIVRC